MRRRSRTTEWIGPPSDVAKCYLDCSRFLTGPTPKVDQRSISSSSTSTTPFLLFPFPQKGSTVRRTIIHPRSAFPRTHLR